MTAGRDFLLLNIRSTAPRLGGVNKWWIFFGGLVWGLIILTWVIFVSPDVRALCKARFGDEPCSTVFNAKGEPVDTKECADWCPLLGRRIEEEEVDDADLVNDASAH